MEKLRAIRQGAHDRVLNSRAIERIVGTDEFADYYSKLDSPGVVELLINSGNKDGLDAWMAECRNEFDYAALSIRELRQLGSKLKIRNYNRISKEQLLLELDNAKKDARQEAGTIDCPPLPAADYCGCQGRGDCEVPCLH